VQQASHTEKILLTLTTELKQALVKKAREMFGERKGSVSIYVEMVLRNNLGLDQPQVLET
jgi:hypothetical protein